MDIEIESTQRQLTAARRIVFRIAPGALFIIFASLTILVWRESGHTSSWSAGIPILLLGLLLSGGMSILLYLLLKRIDSFQLARDQAQTEVMVRQRAEQVARTSEARYQNVFNASTDALFELSSNEIIIEANAAATGFVEASTQLQGMPFEDLLDAGQETQLQEFREHLEHFGSAEAELISSGSNGSKHLLAIRGTRFVLEGERRYLIVATDLSEKRKIEQRQAHLSRKVLLAQEEERARVSRELHDELGQLLTALRLELAMVQRKVAVEDRMVFQSAANLVERSTSEIRRICQGLRPPLLDDLGLGPALRLLVEQFVERTGIDVDLDLKLGETRRSLPLEVALGAYRIIQESLTNISRHAQATAVNIAVFRTATEVSVSVYDNGQGFEVGGLSGIQGVGIEGMRERAHLVNGELEIRSGSYQGTRIELRVPLGRIAQREEP